MIIPAFNFPCHTRRGVLKFRTIFVSGVVDARVERAAGRFSLIAIQRRFMKFILGTKDAMTQIFDENGFAVPVTAINVPENTVVAVKTDESDGYSAVALATGQRRAKNIGKAVMGTLKKAGLEGARFIKEFRVSETEGYEVGQKVELSSFAAGDEIIVSSTSKGKGFQGGVKRHNFSGGRRSHGNKHAEREVGSIGDMGVQRVFKGKKMPGRMGSDRVSIKGLTVMRIDTDNNRLLVKGSIAGKRGDLVEIVSA